MGFEQVTATASVGNSVQAGKRRFVTLKNGNISISQTAYQGEDQSGGAKIHGGV